MQLNIKYTDEQLKKIRDEGIIYECACPSQVSVLVMRLRSLFEYENNCLNKKNDSTSNKESHKIIAKKVIEAHDVMQSCLTEVLTIEEWDLETLDMPIGIRKPK